MRMVCWCLFNAEETEMCRRTQSLHILQGKYTDEFNQMEVENMSVISMKQLLEAGVHFGHQTRRWNPKMAPYIFTERIGIHIIDLQKSVGKVDEAYKAVFDIANEGGTILFVGTKKHQQTIRIRVFLQQENFSTFPAL